MRSATYKICHQRGGWGIEHDGEVTGPYETKEAAFEASIGPASNAIKQGYAVSITVEGSARPESSLGSY
ncbi:MAG TPA: hypothetical protein VE909_02080 [Xanthobacteraceae bacterium]|nr:hypothetical protein [Xanthobacteraceae bacterium]